MNQTAAIQQDVAMYTYCNGQSCDVSYCRNPLASWFATALFTSAAEAFVCSIAHPHATCLTSTSQAGKTGLPGEYDFVAYLSRSTSYAGKPHHDETGTHS